MKKIVFCLLLLTFSFRLAAQIDYLEPVKPFSTYTGELGEYYRSVFSLLNTGFQKQPCSYPFLFAGVCNVGREEEWTLYPGFEHIIAYLLAGREGDGDGGY